MNKLLPSSKTAKDKPISSKAYAIFYFLAHRRLKIYAKKSIFLPFAIKVVPYNLSQQWFSTSEFRNTTPSISYSHKTSEVELAKLLKRHRPEN